MNSLNRCFVLPVLENDSLWIVLKTALCHHCHHRLNHQFLRSICIDFGPFCECKRGRIVRSPATHPSHVENHTEDVIVNSVIIVVVTLMFRLVSRFEQIRISSVLEGYLSSCLVFWTGHKSIGSEALEVESITDRKALEPAERANTWPLPLQTLNVGSTHVVLKVALNTVYLCENLWIDRQER